jgi:hypothetical protein
MKSQVRQAQAVRAASIAKRWRTTCSPCGTPLIGAYHGQTGRNHSASVAIVRAALPIFSQKHLGQVPQGDGADQGYYPEQVPTVPTEMQDAETVQQCGEGHQEEKGAGNVTVYAPTAERVHNTRHAHCGERDSPDDCSPTAADGQRPDCNYRDGRKPIQHENTPPA